jgi:hypothetical protein
VIIFKINSVLVIVFRHELDHDSPVSASSNSLFKTLPSLLRQFGLKFHIIFGILFFFLFILFTCRGQFDFYLLSFSSTGSTLTSSKIFSFFLWS